MSHNITDPACFLNPRTCSVFIDHERHASQRAAPALLVVDRRYVRSEQPLSHHRFCLFSFALINMLNRSHPFDHACGVSNMSQSQSAVEPRPAGSLTTLSEDEQMF